METPGAEALEEPKRTIERMLGRLRATIARRLAWPVKLLSGAYAASAIYVAVGLCFPERLLYEVELLDSASLWIQVAGHVALIVFLLAGASRCAREPTFYAIVLAALAGTEVTGIARSSPGWTIDGGHTTAAVGFALGAWAIGAIVLTRDRSIFAIDHLDRSRTRYDLARDLAGKRTDIRVAWMALALVLLANIAFRLVFDLNREDWFSWNGAMLGWFRIHVLVAALLLAVAPLGSLPFAFPRRSAIAWSLAAIAGGIVLRIGGDAWLDLMYRGDASVKITDEEYELWDSSHWIRFGIHVITEPMLVEFIDRGLLFGILSRLGLSRVRVVLLTSILSTIGFVDLRYASELPSLLGVFLSSLASGFLRARTDSLAPSMLLSVTRNAWSWMK